MRLSVISNNTFSEFVYVWCKSTPHQVAGSFPDMQALSVVPAEIIKTLALVGYITV